MANENEKEEHAPFVTSFPLTDPTSAQFQLLLEIKASVGASTAVIAEAFARALGIDPEPFVTDLLERFESVKEDLLLRYTFSLQEHARKNIEHSEEKSSPGNMTSHQDS